MSAPFNMLKLVWRPGEETALMSTPGSGGSVGLQFIWPSRGKALCISTH